MKGQEEERKTNLLIVLTIHCLQPSGERKGGRRKVSERGQEKRGIGQPQEERAQQEGPEPGK